MAKQEISGKISQEELDVLVEKHGTVHEIEVEDKICYLRPIDRKTMSLASKMAAQDPLKFNEVVLENCWLAGDEAIKNDDAYFLGAGSSIAEMIDVKSSTLKKHSKHQS